MLVHVVNCGGGPRAPPSLRGGLCPLRKESHGSRQPKTLERGARWGAPAGSQAGCVAPVPVGGRTEVAPGVGVLAPQDRPPDMGWKGCPSQGLALWSPVREVGLCCWPEDRGRGSPHPASDPSRDGLGCGSPLPEGALGSLLHPHRRTLLLSHFTDEQSEAQRCHLPAGSGERQAALLWGLGMSPCMLPAFCGHRTPPAALTAAWLGSATCDSGRLRAQTVVLA